MSPSQIKIVPSSHSFGYDCNRRQNLHVLDSRTLLYCTGDYLHFLRPDDGGSLWCQPSARGRGISCASVHPTEPVLAVAEREAPRPPVLVYSWPELDVVAALKGGAEEDYSCMAFRYKWGGRVSFHIPFYFMILSSI